MATKMQHKMTGNDDYTSRPTSQISWVQQYIPWYTLAVHH